MGGTALKQLLLKGRIIDAVSESALEKGAVLLEGEKIAYAGPEAGCPACPGAEEFAIEGGSILPGFIDVHAHLCGTEDAGSFAGGALFGDQLMGAVYQAGLLLDAGFTGLRDMSEAGLYLSRAVERGAVRGPRIVPGGKVLGITSGHVDMGPQMSKEDYNARDHLSMLCDGPDECVRAVREQFRMGAKFNKICATG